MPRDKDKDEVDIAERENDRYIDSICNEHGWAKWAKRHIDFHHVVQTRFSIGTYDGSKNDLDCRIDFKYLNFI